MFLKNLSIICPFAQIVRGRRRRRRRRRRLVAPRPGGDFVAPGKSAAAHNSSKIDFSEHLKIPTRCSITREIE
jgi:hypothetical protein